MRIRDRQLEGARFRRQYRADQRRTAYLEQCGYKVLRFWNNEVPSNLDGVLERIASCL
jgi:very-short-patch-repair endonuclease